MDSLELLKKACELYGQRKVGEKLGYSATTVNQVTKGIYVNPEPVLHKVDIVFKYLDSDETICPLLGVIHIQTCDRYREWAMSGKVHHDRMYQEVKDTCATCAIGSKR